MSMTLIGSANLGITGNVTFSNIPDDGNNLIVFLRGRTVGAIENAKISFNQSNSSYLHTRLSATSSSSIGRSTDTSSSLTKINLGRIPGVTTQSQIYGNIEAIVHGYSNSSAAKIVTSKAIATDSTTNSIIDFFGGVWDGQGSKINSVTISIDSSGWQSGSYVYLYKMYE